MFTEDFRCLARPQNSGMMDRRDLDISFFRQPSDLFNRVPARAG
jgi:hypothetical protein